MATEGDWKDITKYLIDHGADVNALNVMQRSPLHNAATNNRLEIGLMLLKAGYYNCYSCKNLLITILIHLEYLNII